jgi:cohesin complex subunit SA-1/2
VVRYFKSKLATNVASVDSSKLKRKRAGSDTEDAVSGLEEDPFDQEDNQEEEGDDGEDFRAPKAKPKTTRKPKAKTGGPPVSKKPRTTKTVSPKGTKTAGRKPRKGKAGDDAFDATKITKETKITADNPLFSTCRIGSFFRVI